MKTRHCAIGIAVLAALIYLNALPNGFVSDDNQLIFEHPYTQKVADFDEYLSAGDRPAPRVMTVSSRRRATLALPDQSKRRQSLNSKRHRSPPLRRNRQDRAVGGHQRFRRRLRSPSDPTAICGSPNSERTGSGVSRSRAT